MGEVLLDATVFVSCLYVVWYDEVDSASSRGTVVNCPSEYEAQQAIVILGPAVTHPSCTAASSYRTRSAWNARLSAVLSIETGETAYRSICPSRSSWAFICERSSGFGSYGPMLDCASSRGMWTEML